MALANRQGKPASDLPDPENLPFASDEIDFLYDLWVLWNATDKRYLPSQLIPELQSGHGRILSGLLEMESLYERTKASIKRQHKPMNTDSDNA